MSTSWHQHAVALTGTIGSGKSTVAALFKKLGAYVVSADDLAREAVKKSSEGLKQVVELFGKEILTPDGELDRKKLGTIVFSDGEKRKKLEEITHPTIRRLAKEAYEVGFKKGYPLYVYDCPLLFEAKLDSMGFKKIVLIKADNKTCIERIMKRDGLSKEDAENRLRAQYPIEEKEKRADIIIDNSSTLQHLENEVKKLFDLLKS